MESRPRSQVNRWSMRGQLYHLSHTLWEAGATPGTLVRGLGPWGPSLIQKYARNRCAHVPPCATSSLESSGGDLMYLAANAPLAAVHHLGRRLDYIAEVASASYGVVVESMLQILEWARDVALLRGMLLLYGRDGGALVQVPRGHGTEQQGGGRL